MTWSGYSPRIALLWPCMCCNYPRSGLDRAFQRHAVWRSSSMVYTRSIWFAYVVYVRDRDNMKMRRRRMTAEYLEAFSSIPFSHFCSSAFFFYYYFLLSQYLLFFYPWDLTRIPLSCDMHSLSIFLSIYSSFLERKIFIFRPRVTYSR